MLELSWIFIAYGIFFGILAGVLPGVGMTVVVILASPLLILYESNEIIQFYLTAILISQFVGSIVATYFAVPGEPSSIPAVIEGNKLAREGKGNQAIYLAAIGSAVGGLIAFVLIWFLGQNLGVIFKNFGTLFNVIMITLVVILLFFIPAKNWIERYVFPLVGLTLGMLGESTHDVNINFSLGIELLETGIPAMPLLLGLYTLPLLLVLIQKKATSVESFIQSISIRDIVFGINHFFLSVFHAILGFVIAFIPGIGLNIVSNLSYEIQKKMNKYTEKKNQGQYGLLAAETANNSGAISVMLPLVLFGLPTTTSQAILYNILLEKYFLFGPESFSSLLINSILQVLLVTTFAGLILAGPCASIIGKLFEKFERQLYIFVAILMVIVILYVGKQTYNLELYMWIVIVSFIVGWICRNMDVLRIIYFFIISTFLVENFTRILFMWDLM